MRLLGHKSMKKAVQEGAVRRVMAVRQAAGGWYLTFEADDPVGESPVQCALRTVREKADEPRVWSTSDALFRFIEANYGIRCGGFLMEKGDDGKDG